MCSDPAGRYVVTKCMMGTLTGLLVGYGNGMTYRRDPERNLTPALFGCHAGLRINWDKWLVFPFTSTGPVQIEYPLQWMDESVHYLGIKIYSDPAVVLLNNYGTAVQRLSEAVENWVRLPLSLGGRLVIKKMVVLPRFLCRLRGSRAPSRGSETVTRCGGKDGVEQGALSVFVYCRDQALSVTVRRDQPVFVCRRERALSVSVYRRDSRIE
ncbi:hypothetical protein NDU88_002718 [Pleurodeles waltl]|uniref:Uncharacterized protein n=1 Tax=Pleurodeles waltl TaxID=8319 RepID=A0AAV7TLZ5_PLEWA|nr:hypothetical protein NDU88_002718 [Pleurodeles waltl]